MSFFVKILNLLNFNKLSNGRLSKESDVLFDSVKVKESEFTYKINTAMDEYLKRYSFGKDVINNADPQFDILNDFVRYLHTRFDDNDWNEDDVFGNLPDWYRHAYLAWALDAEVQNGGLGQYFTNSAGKHAADTVLAFNIMGSERLSEFLQSAIELNEACEKLESENTDEEELLKCDKKN